MTQFEILSTVSAHGGSIGYVDLLNLDLKSANPDSYATKQLVSALIRDGLLSGSVSSSGVVRIEPSGRLCLDTHLLYQKDLEASAASITQLTNELSATRLALEETSQKLAAAESALVVTNSRLAEAEVRAKQSDKKARLYAVLGIVATAVFTVFGWLMGKYL